MPSEENREIKQIPSAISMAAQPFAGADSRFSRICPELGYDRRGKRAAQLKADRAPSSFMNGVEVECVLKRFLFISFAKLAVGCACDGELTCILCLV
jgi:hypothetical protein